MCNFEGVHWSSLVYFALPLIHESTIIKFYKHNLKKWVRILPKVKPAYMILVLPVSVMYWLGLGGLVPDTKNRDGSIPNFCTCLINKTKEWKIMETLWLFNIAGIWDWCLMHQVFIKKSLTEFVFIDQ